MSGKGQAKKSKKHGRGFKSPAHKRYVAENRRDKNKAKKIAKQKRKEAKKIAKQKRKEAEKASK